jgi:hypothetical protein
MTLANSTIAAKLQNFGENCMNETPTTLAPIIFLAQIDHSECGRHATNFKMA